MWLSIVLSCFIVWEMGDVVSVGSRGRGLFVETAGDGEQTCTCQKMFCFEVFDVPVVGSVERCCDVVVMA